MTTGLIHAEPAAFAVDFDFIDHTLFIRASDGQTRSMPLVPRSVAAFYHEFLDVLRSMAIAVTIDPMPVEIPDPIPCHLDHDHDAYDPEMVHRWWRIMVATDGVMQRFRSSFVGKSSPVNFFWGSFDLGLARFSGRPATPPAGAPRWLQIAETQENFACGFWPGNANMAGYTLGEPAFYAYHYPAPPGFREATLRPDAAFFHPDLGEFILRYDDALATGAPGEAVLAFLESAYDAAASRAGWDRGALEFKELTP
jgi:hypothetical protein